MDILENNLRRKRGGGSWGALSPTFLPNLYIFPILKTIWGLCLIFILLPPSLIKIDHRAPHVPFLWVMANVKVVLWTDGLTDRH